MNFFLPDYRQVSILVIGDLILDRYWHGPIERVSPEAPVPVVQVEESEERAGGAANVAMNIASLGGKVHVIGLTGRDESSQVLKKLLTSLNISCNFAELPECSTLTKLRVLSRGQQMIRLDFEENFKHLDPTLILSRMESVLSDVKAVIMSDYAKGSLEHVQQFIRKAREYNVPLFIDPKGASFDRYSGATLLKPNMAEFENVVGRVGSGEEFVEKGLGLISDYELGALLVTRGTQGMTLLRRDMEPFHLTTQAKDVYDVTGAGDTVIAVLAASFAAGTSLSEACMLANVAAGIVVGKLGTSTVETVELAGAIHVNRSAFFGVIGEDALIRAVNEAQVNGEKVVMTNGCFDILHSGHVAYLNRAAKLGDRLIVAVNTDESVQRLKGLRRPVNSLDKRMAVLAGLKSVDWVIPFTEDTPQQLIAAILPDLLVKGGDYRLEDISGREEVIAAGGEVKVLNFEEGCSTTEIVRAIN